MSEPIDDRTHGESDAGPDQPAPAQPQGYVPAPQPYSAPPPQAYGAPPQPYSAPPPQGYVPAPQPYSAAALPVPAVQQDGLVEQPYGGAAPRWPVTAPYRLVPPEARFGAALLDGLILLVTFGIGWWVWSAVTWQNGQSPAKSLLGHVVADPQTGQPFDWGRMALREFVIRGLLLGFGGAITFGVLPLVDSLMIFGTNSRTLHDQMSGSIVRYL